MEYVKRELAARWVEVDSGMASVKKAKRDMDEAQAQREGARMKEPGSANEKPQDQFTSGLITEMQALLRLERSRHIAAQADVDRLRNSLTNIQSKYDSLVTEKALLEQMRSGGQGGAAPAPQASAKNRKPDAKHRFLLQMIEAKVNARIKALTARKAVIDKDVVSLDADIATRKSELGVAATKFRDVGKKLDSALVELRNSGSPGQTGGTVQTKDDGTGKKTPINHAANNIENAVLTVVGKVAAWFGSTEFQMYFVVFALVLLFPVLVLNVLGLPSTIQWGVLAAVVFAIWV